MRLPKFLRVQNGTRGVFVPHLGDKSLVYRFSRCAPPVRTAGNPRIYAAKQQIVCVADWWSISDKHQILRKLAASPEQRRAESSSSFLISAMAVLVKRSLGLDNESAPSSMPSRPYTGAAKPQRIGLE